MTSEAHNTPVSTPSGPPAGMEGQDATQEKTQDATEAAQRRVERYAEAVWKGTQPVRAVIAVADQEQAELRAEVERLREDKRWFERARDQWILTTEEQVTALAREEDRADAAEARVAELEARVRALVDDWRRLRGWPETVAVPELRAILDAPKDTTAP